MSIRRGSGYSALDIEIIEEEEEDEDNEDREEKVSPVARGGSVDFGKSLPNKLCFDPVTMDDNRDTPSPEQQSGNYEDFKENSTLKLISSLEDLGTKNASRLAGGIRRQSVAAIQSHHRLSISGKGKNGGRNSLKNGTILEIPSEEKSIDSVLGEINPFGRFHQVLLLLLFCGAAPIIGFHTFVLEVQTVIPSWKCLDNRCVNETENYSWSTYHINNTDVLCSLERDSWEWDAILYNSVSQWDIACSSGKIILELVFHVPGGILGALLISNICDKMGRRLSFLVSLIASLTVGTMISSAQFFEAYVTFRLILGMSLTCLHLVNYIWIIEHFAMSSRALANAAYDFTRLCCVPLLTLLNSYVHSWNYLHLASTISLLTGILVFFAVPESPRWFLMKGNVEAAEGVLKAVARRNNEQYPRRINLQHKHHDKIPIRAKCGSYIQYGVIIAIWTALHLSYMFMKSKVVHFNDNINIREAAYSAGGLPFILITGLYLCEKAGRRGTLIILLMLALLCCGLTLLPFRLNPTLSTTDMMPTATVYGLFPAIMSVITLWAVELLPTLHRVCVYSLLLAIRHSLISGAPLLLPYIDYSYKHTSVVLAVILLLASLFLTLLIQETKGQHMLEVPPQEEFSTRGMTLIKETINSLNLPVQPTDLSADPPNGKVDVG